MNHDASQQFQQLEDRLNLAYEQNDTGLLQTLLSAEWTMVEPGIGLVSRENFLQAIAEKRLVHTHMHKQVMHAQVFEQTAIVITQGRNCGVYNGKPFDTEVYVTNVYQQQENWVCVSTHESPIQGK